MPLDSGAGADSIMVAKGGGPDGERLKLETLLDSGVEAGPALRMLREAKGLSQQEISKITYVRRAYLQAIEDMDLDRLPAGPFAAGYVRAYAQALGVSPERAVAAFRKHAPSDEALKPPSGIERRRDNRLSLAAGLCGVVIVAVGIWNVAQHAVAHDGAPTPPAPVVNAPPAAPLGTKGPVALGAAQPAPADSDVPTPYVTPGMAKAVGDPAAEAAAGQPAPVHKPYLNPRAAVYGAPADKSAVTLRAQKAASLVIHGADGSIYFARQLAAGEAFRAPANVPGLTVETSDPQAFDVIVGGQDKGALPSAQTSVGKLTS